LAYLSAYGARPTHDESSLRMAYDRVRGKDTTDLHIEDIRG
jgi:hypothetical protein